jgi:hypothetical protein
VAPLKCGTAPVRCSAVPTDRILPFPTLGTIHDVRLPNSHRTLLLLLAAVPACSGPREPSLTPLLGHWTTSAPLYAGRSLEITAQRELILGTGEGLSERCRIVGVRGEVLDEDRRSFSLDYRNADGASDTLDLELSLQRDCLRLRSRPEIPWTRTDEP